MTSIPVPGKCHFDEHGWLQGPVSITHVMTPNRYNSGFADRGRGVVMHTEDGFEAGTVATFMNPKSQASAFFSIGRNGHVTQYLPVGQGYVAWTQGAGNDAWRGVEDEDRTHPSIPLTLEQVAAFAQILEACSEFDGFPLQVTDDVNGHGLIWHGAGGQPWGGHPDCPGEVRKAQRPLIVSLAEAIREGHVSGARQHVTQGKLSLAGLAAKQEPPVTPAQIVFLTAQHSAGGHFAANVAHWLGDVFEGRLDAQADIPAGLHLWLPASP
jgi:hypothetical protein